MKIELSYNDVYSVVKFFLIWMIIFENFAE